MRRETRKADAGGSPTRGTSAGAHFAHPQALVESPHIGAGTRVWAFAHILPGARIGADCNICDGVFVENDVVVGDRVTVKCGVQLWDGVTLEDDVFVGPNATFTNDAFPRSRVHPDRFLRTTVQRGASIGANATILPGITIGSGAMIGAGSVVTRDVAPGTVVVGNPARMLGTVGQPDAAGRGCVSEVELPRFTDARGTLVFGQAGDQLPFAPRRFFTISDVPEGAARGAHAHRIVHQFFVMLRGSCTLLVDDGRGRRTLELRAGGAGIYVPPLHWNELSTFSRDALLLCLASAEYDPDEYIHDYDAFRHATGAA